MNDTKSLYLPRTEVQKLLGVNLQAMKRIEKQGSLKPIKQVENTPHAKVFYLRSEFKSYLERINNPKVA